MEQDWEITWSYPGLWSLRQMPWQDGAAIDGALQRFALTGEGHLERVQGSPKGYWLKAQGHVARLSIDTTSRTIVVWWVCRAWW